jgi:ribosomal protein L7/L12
MADGQLRRLKSVLAQNIAPEGTQAARALREYGFDPDAVKALAETSGAGHGRVNILSDLPAREDSLGFGPLIRTLCNIVLSRSTETPITLAIDGEWGSGKTSILRMIEAQARLIGFSCIWLNAWNLESAENLIAAVAHEIQDELAKRNRVTETARGKLFNFVVSALGYVAPTIDALSGNKVGAISAALNLKTTKQSISDSVQEVASVVSSQQAFRDLVQLLLESQRSDDPRLLIFIDDVDRALPDQVATILKNLKLILESERCIFVLAMDMRLVANAIEDHYRKGAHIQPFVSLSEISGSQIDLNMNERAGFDSARSNESSFGIKYLEKLVQLRVAVPRLARPNVVPFLNSLSIAPEVAEIVGWIPDSDALNPRRLKQFLNWLSLMIQLMNAIQPPSDLENLSLLKLLAVRRCYPALYIKLKSIEFRSDKLIDAWMSTAGSFSTPSIHTAFVRSFGAADFQSRLRSAVNYIESSPILNLDRATTVDLGTIENGAYRVVLVDGGEKKISVIKEVRAITQLGLKESKDLVEGAPKLLKEVATWLEAQDIKRILEAAGAKVELE